jgi:pimeloyl-ACP methyl ester carboxylesterase
VVRQDRADPERPTLRIPFAVFRAEAASTKAPVFYLTGGPGGTWTDTVPAVQAGRSPGFGGGAQLDRDEVVLEQRGSSATTPALTCPALSSVAWGPEMFRDVAAALVSALTRVTTCAQALVAGRTLPRHFNTEAMAADVEDLRRLLGYREVVLNGVSYGSQWALTVVRNHGANVQAVVLDSVLSAAVFPNRHWGAGLDDSLAALGAACAAQADCARAYPNLDGRISTLLDRLNARPVPWSRGPGGEFSASVALATLESVAAFDPGALPRLVGNLESLLATDGRLDALPLATQDELAAFAREGWDSSAAPAPGQLWSVSCADNGRTSRAEMDAAVQRLRPALRPALGSFAESYDAICRNWPFRVDLPDSHFAPVSSPVKALLLSGDLDPLTPPAWAQAVAGTLPNASWVRFPARSHSVQVASACARTLVAHFLDERPLEAACAAAERVSFE